MKQRNTSELQSPTSIKCLVYGSSGSGKTVFASTFPDPIFIDADRGLLSIRSKNIPFLDFSDEDPSTVWTSFMYSLRDLISTNAHKTIVIDSLTTIEEMAISFSQFNNKTTGVPPNQFDYGCRHTKMTEFISTIRTSQAHIVVTAHEQMTKDDFLGKTFYRPMLGGRLGGDFPLYFDEVYHTEVILDSDSRSVYSIQVQNSFQYVAKSRILSNISIPNNRIVNPSFDKIIEASKPKQEGGESL